MEWAALFALLGLVVQAVQAIWVASIRAEQQEVRKAQTEVAAAQVGIHTKMKELVDHTNGIKDALVKVTGEAEFAKGIKVGEANVTNATS